MPKLTGPALEAVRHRGGHVQIIAAAGSGKTEVVSQRVVDLLADGLPAEAIVAFTFTERAADELKQRIERRTQERLGRAALDRLTSLFVGTIHAYCFRLLQQHVPRYETYDVLDENQLTAFLSREATRSCPRPGWVPNFRSARAPVCLGTRSADCRIGTSQGCADRLRGRAARCRAGEQARRGVGLGAVVLLRGADLAERQVLARERPAPPMRDEECRSRALPIWP